MSDLTPLHLNVPWRGARLLPALWRSPLTESAMIAANKLAILVVDDEPGITATLALILQDSGYTVVTAATGGAALNAVAGVGFDAALVDFHLPDSNGITLAREICKKLPRCRILLITGSIELTELEQARDGKSGFDVLTKPVAPKELLKRLGEMLHDRKSVVHSG